MRKVISIEGKEVRKSKAGKMYTITHIMTDDGTVAEFYGTDIHEGNEVEVFYHWGKVKARLPLDSK